MKIYNKKVEYLKEYTKNMKNGYLYYFDDSRVKWILLTKACACKECDVREELKDDYPELFL